MDRKSLLAASVVASMASLSMPYARAEDPMPAKGLVADQGPDLWRGSKLVGVNVYGPDNKKVGDISDVLMSHDGRATFAIIGVGGFLGIGEKDIAIPFDQIAFTDQPLNPSPAPSTSAGANDGATGGGLAPASPTGLGSPATDTTGSATAPAPTGSLAATPAMSQPSSMQRSTAYPDHGLISLTAEQLKQAPAFHYAR